jgi:hypothetical protein
MLARSAEKLDQERGERFNRAGERFAGKQRAK